MSNNAKAIINAYNSMIDVSKSEAVHAIAIQFEIPDEVAESYYLDWRKQYIKPKDVKKEKSLIVNIESNAKNNITDMVNMFIPVVLKGKFGTYSFEEDGVALENNEKFLNEESLNEQKIIIDIWKSYYKKDE